MSRKKRRGPLDTNTVRHIRAESRHGGTAKQIAARYFVSVSTVYRIVRHVTYRGDG